MANAFAKFLIFTTALSLLVLCAGATYLTVEGPVSALLYSNGTLNLGKVGPGESFYVLASAATANQSGAIVNIGWDTLQAIQLPTGWSAEASPLYQNPMKIKITVAPYADNGTYNMTLRAVNVGNYSKLGNLTFTAQINVTPSVFSPSVNPTNITAGVGQPTNLRIVINNTGASDDPFIVNVSGLPAWNSPAEVIATHSTSSTYLYPIFMDEPGIYHFNLTIDSATSPLLHQTFPITLTAQSSLVNDFSATGQGVVLSPVIYEPAYAVMLLLSDIYHYVFG
ncbi:MAG: hypothetical protein KGI04_04810 [Candidatus Micrarchaeota archaeon]|nr:hypothetical protein [Candidatus Micrarchaeota archaeon]